jgi:hypothetical protein
MGACVGKKSVATKPQSSTPESTSAPVKSAPQQRANAPKGAPAQVQTRYTPPPQTNGSQQQSGKNPANLVKYTSGKPPDNEIVPILRKYKAEVDRSELKFTECTDRIHKILRNIIENPDECKFRQIKEENKMYRNYIGRFPSGVEVLKLLGFV